MTHALFFQAGGEVVMSMEMWWRSAALEALQAFVLGPLKEASKAEATKLQKSVVALMQPTFEAISASPALQVNFSDSLHLRVICHSLLPLRHSLFVLLSGHAFAPTCSFSLH